MTKHVLLTLGLLLCGVLGIQGEKFTPRGNASGIVFFSTRMLPEIKRFYQEEIGCRLWLDQGGCAIFRYGNLLIGFCQGREAEVEGMITFFFEDRDDVDSAYARFKDIATGPPRENPRYRIYQFFAKDPEGRSLEFQYFLHPLEWDFKAVQPKKQP
jgi:hypothetical protein